jgi:heme/copper-type cytochrome/quinol oxidase subunit 2
MVGAAGAAGLVLTVLALVADTRPAPREIVLIARGMAFYLGGEAQPNPPLALLAGEHVRLVLRNDDLGFTHNFAVPDWAVATASVPSGETTVVEFRVPDRPGRYEYRCTPHGRMMRGDITVTRR